MIGLIFGETDFPEQILKKVKYKEKYLIIDLTKSKNFKNDRNSYSISLGQFGKIIRILKENKCKKVLFAGKVRKPKFSKLRLDLKGIYYMPGIIKSAKLGDAAILKKIINIFKREKITTVSSLFFNPELALKRGNYTKLKPNKDDRADIKKAVITLNKLGKYNSSQGVVVRNKKIIAIEGSRGTQKMLEKCKNKKFKKTGVLVKFPKKKQDLRIDLPTIGLKTLTQCKLSGLKGIVLKSKQNIFLEQKKCISYANKNKMFIQIK
tara:strand:- start:145 stop:936 length:792 start_codon:yes stop_codon:yes gene_type:complete